MAERISETWRANIDVIYELFQELFLTLKRYHSWGESFKGLGSLLIILILDVHSRYTLCQGGRNGKNITADYFMMSDFISVYKPTH